MTETPLAQRAGLMKAVADSLASKGPRRTQSAIRALSPLRRTAHEIKYEPTGAHSRLRAQTPAVSPPRLSERTTGKSPPWKQPASRNRRNINMKFSHTIACAGMLLVALSTALAQEKSGRQMELLNGPDWQFIGAGDTAELPKIGSDEFTHAAWANVSVPHDFQTRTAYDTLTRGWYRRQVTVDPSAGGKELYLIFEGRRPSPMFTSMASTSASIAAPIPVSCSMPPRRSMSARTINWRCW